MIPAVGHILVSRGGGKGRWRLLAGSSEYSATGAMTLSTASSESQLIAIAQMTAKTDKDANFETCKVLVERAVERGAKMVFLPEGCDYMAESKQQSLDMAEPITGMLIEKYKQLASSLGVWLSLGGLHIKEEGASKISNTHVVISSEGEIKAKYEKTHLFNVHIPERNLRIDESSYVERGNAVVPPVITPVGLLGLSTCYDMRFPEFSFMQRTLGAQILSFPSAFMLTTGLAHWEPLLRARAIETQCYVVAAAQTGTHNSKRSSYGHAMVIDPWGSIIAQVSEGTNIALAEINLEYLKKVRQEMPVLNHRRHDLYHLSTVTPPTCPWLIEWLPPPSNYASYLFGETIVPGGCIFLKTRLALAFVNKKPVVPGHVLIAPERPAKRFVDLNVAEVSDVAQVVQQVQVITSQAYASLQSLIAIQDGSNAGQTVSHIHVHVLPWHKRLQTSLEGDEEVDKMEWRELDEMAEEADNLRKVTLEVEAQELSTGVEDIPKPMELKKCDEESIEFSSLQIPSEKIFLYTGRSFAFLTSDPILPGHAYVSTCREVTTFRDMTPGEVTDFFFAIQCAQKNLEKSQGVESSTVVILDGKEAGQTIQQLHAHIIPRRSGDFEVNDDIYKSIHTHNNKFSPEKLPDDKKLIANLHASIYSKDMN